MSMDIFSFLESANSIKIEPKPWMTDGSHKLIRCTTEMLPKVVDDCIASGMYSLDVEATSLDTRVFDGETVSKIVGCCLSPDGKTGYYIPLRHKKGMEHNVPWSFWKREMLRLINSDAKAIFHYGKFDQEMLQWCGGEPLGEWDDPKRWEDTFILAYLRDTRAKQKGLKYLAKSELGMEMIELDELFPKKTTRLDFSELDPSWDPVIWYGASDAICTWKLYGKLAPPVLNPEDGIPGQGLVYGLEKLCVAATRWMERARILTDQEKAKDLIRIGQREWFAALKEVYESASEIVGRDIAPGYYRILRGDSLGCDNLKFNTEEVQPGYMVRVDLARGESDKRGLDPTFKDDKKKVRVKTLNKRVPSLTNKGLMEDVDFPLVYDILVAQELGALLRECKIPGLTVTEKSGQVATNQDELERVLEEVGDKYPFAGKIKRFREVSKALGTYLLPIIEDCAPDHTLRAQFNAHKIDTGRFNAPSSKDPSVDGGTRFPFHGTPATYDPKRPECLARIRECIIARQGKVIAAIDFSGVELRIVTNLSGEPKWMREFFHCSTCDKMFSMGDGTYTPEAPPFFCPECGSDKIGDLHTLTGISIYGDDATKKPDWKLLRGHAKCVHPDTLVFRKDGHGVLRTIGNITGEGPDDTFTPSNGLVWSGSAWSPVQEVYHGGVKPMYHVVTNHGILTCSENHSIQLVDGSLKTVGGGLVRGDELAVPTAPELTNAPYDPIPIRLNPGVPVCLYTPTNDTSYFAGLLSGDGTTRTASSMIVHGLVGKTDRTGTPYQIWQDILVGMCSKVGLTPVRRPEGVYLGSAILAKFLEPLGLVFGKQGVGKGKATKTLRIPTWVLDAGPKAIFHFVGGLMDTDGTVGRDGSASITTKDAVFAGQIASVLRACGKHAMVDPGWNKKYQRWYFRVRIPSSQALFLKQYMRHPGKCARLKTTLMGSLKNTNHVLQIIPATPGKCVDFSLSTTDHLYWANGFVTHNSCNFALCYGGGGNAVVAAVGCDKSEGWRIKEVFDKTYKGLSGWWGEQHKFAKKHKFVVTPFGRRYPLPDIDHELGGFRSKAERNAVNGPIQGASADITKLAMGLVYKECKKRGWLEKVHMLITMHDELVFEIDLDILEVAVDTFVNIMCRNPALLRLHWPVPLTSDVELGHSWMVPWDLKKIRKTGECPPELEGCFSNTKPKISDKGQKESPKSNSTPSKPTRVYKVSSFDIGQIEPLARLFLLPPKTPAMLKVEGPSGEDLTGVFAIVWGSPLPEVDVND